MISNTIAIASLGLLGNLIEAAPLQPKEPTWWDNHVAGLTCRHNKTRLQEDKQYYECNPWWDSTLKIGVDNWGMPYGSLTHSYYLKSMTPVLDGLSSYAGVKRIGEVLPQSAWKEVFSHANDIYSYESFLNAAKAYPQFCNDAKAAHGKEGDEREKILVKTCKKELAGLFANWT